jgi:microcystin-dependent protein
MTPFISQISIFGFKFAPRGWATCDGTLLEIHNNQALFALIGSNFGGNGTTDFALPDFRGRVPVCQESTKLYSTHIGQYGGHEQVALDEHSMALHTHTVHAVRPSDTSSNTNQPSAKVLATSPAGKEIYNIIESTDSRAMSTQAITPVGSNLPHNNMQPSLVLNFCIALQGDFPPHS